MVDETMNWFELVEFCFYSLDFYLIGKLVMEFTQVAGSSLLYSFYLLISCLIHFVSLIFLMLTFYVLLMLFISLLVLFRSSSSYLREFSHL